MNRLQEIREIKKITQLQLAEYLGVGVNTYANYEIGKQNLDLETVVMLAEYLEVTTDYILGKGREEELKARSNDKILDSLLLKEATNIAERIHSLSPFLVLLHSGVAFGQRSVYLSESNNVEWQAFV